MGWKPNLLTNNTQVNSTQNQNVSSEQILDTSTSYSNQEREYDKIESNTQTKQNLSNDTEYNSQYSNEKQQLFQHHMRMVAKKFTNNLEAANKKCGLSSPALARCFANSISEMGDSSVSGSVMTFMGDGWKFSGDGVCKKSGSCNIEIISHDDINIKATIPIYVNENGYITVE